MSLWSGARTILRPGRVTETARRRSDLEQARVPASTRRGSVQLRHVDAGSCNGCEMEVVSAFGPVYDAERFGARLVASPRHADALLVTGPVTRNMARPLAKTFDAMPEPRLVVALGDCARDCGVFRGGYGVEGAVGDVLAVDVHVAGCPPSPDAIVDALRGLTGR
ncbi:MAG: NADH-quinone oxidoreductase subunit B family protein [Acidimicrobiales bacterium]